MKNRESWIDTAFFVSGGGSTVGEILKFWDEGGFERIHPVALVSSRADAGAIALVEAFNESHGTDISIHVMNRKMYGGDQQRFGHELITLMNELGVDYIAQRGWLPLTPRNLVDEFNIGSRIIDNQHPGPNDPGRSYDGRLFDEMVVADGVDPAALHGRAVDFGGQGMYGQRVAAARLYYAYLTEDVREAWTEATLHYVTSRLDEGKLIHVTQMDLGKYWGLATLAEIDVNPAVLRDVAEYVQHDLLPIEYGNVIAGMKLHDSGMAVPGFYRDQPLVPVDLKNGRDYRELAVRAKQFVNDLYQKT